MSTTYAKLVIALTLLISIPANALVLKGGVEHRRYVSKSVKSPIKRRQAPYKVLICQKAKLDVRKPFELIASEQHRGLIGIHFDPTSGAILDIAIHSDLHRLGIETGDIITGVEGEDFRPCRLVVLRKAGYLLKLRIKRKNGSEVDVSVKLKENPFEWEGYDYGPGN